ncbi:MAG: lactate utilization protein [Spirochaetes bacterium]|nr:lactate utilization protein [Spirochaetota bacterium]
METSERKKRLEIKVLRTIENLRKRNFGAEFFETKEEAIKYFLTKIDKDKSIGYGGSRTLEQIEIIQYLRENNYNLLDRNKDGLTKDQREEIQKKILTCEIFISSSNGISETGEIVNIDLWGNRICPIIYGPKKVFIFAGWNKIEDDLEKTIYRVKNIASVQNAIRFNRNTPCTKSGRCFDCISPERICGTLTIISYCGEKERIEVLFIKEDLGF